MLPVDPNGYFYYYYFIFYFAFYSGLIGVTQMEGPSGGLQSNLLLKAGSAMRSARNTQGFIQLGLENIHGQRLHNLFGQPVPLPACPR